jgi:hypothetical protein
MFFKIRIPLLILWAASSTFVSSARAGDDFVIYSPHVTQGEAEIELRGFRYSDGNAGVDRSGMYGVGVGYGFTSWWKAELYSGPFEYGPETDTHLRGAELENFFQLAKKGEYWVDPGFLVAYTHSNQPGVANRVEFGPLLQKDSEATIQRLNLLWEKEIGSNASGKYNFRAAYMAGYKITEAFAPGIEAFYRPNDNARQIGPGFSGEVEVGHEKSIEYSGSLLYGINEGAPARTLVLRVSYVF